jgi:hypothetical protein
MKKLILLALLGFVLAAGAGGRGGNGQAAGPHPALFHSEFLGRWQIDAHRRAERLTVTPRTAVADTCTTPSC